MNGDFNLEGAEINKAKEILAYEVTKLVHGEEEAKKAMEGARAAFGGGGNSANIPSTEMAAAEFEGEGKGLISLLKETGLVPSNGEGRRAIEQGGVSVNGEKIADVKLFVTTDMFEDGELLIQKGKKKFHKIIIK